ncbi:MAG: arginine N-succinyltransferase [Planctomycetes bacterium]|nr:arginine N-succinyltransferase [Planctomycetota bacterium]
MFVIRQATLEDLPTLLKLAKMVHFLNLPADRDIIATKISRSRLSFADRQTDTRHRQFMFVLEDAETGNVIGTSAVIACISWKGWPHVFLEVRKRHFYSNDLQQGQSHVTLEFGTDESGPSEVGGLILAPGYRGHAEKLGSLLSLIRFHFIGLHKKWFAPRILAEMMGPVTPDSRTLLWEYLGRRFINLSYQEADLFCQHSKEFMTNLWPRGEIFASILPPDARALIGKVGEETLAAKAMLDRQGFQVTTHVDPFDGGPYLEADRDSIPMVRQTKELKLTALSKREAGVLAFVSHSSKEHGFRAVRTLCQIRNGGVEISREAAEAIHAREGAKVGVSLHAERSPKAGVAKKSSARTTTVKRRKTSRAK